MPLHSLRLGAGVSHLPLFERWRTKCLIEYESLFHLWLIWQLSHSASDSTASDFGQQVERQTH